MDYIPRPAAGDSVITPGPHALIVFPAGGWDEPSRESPLRVRCISAAVCHGVHPGETILNTGGGAGIMGMTGGYVADIANT